MAQIYFASSSLKYANEEINLHPFAVAQTKMEDEREKAREREREGAKEISKVQPVTTRVSTRMLGLAGLAWLTAHVWGINSTSIFKASESNAPELAAESKD